MLNFLISLYIKLWDKIQKYFLIKRHKKEVLSYTERRVLTRQQKKLAKEFYRPYSKIRYLYHNFYTEKTGEFYPEYISDDVWYNDVDQYYNKVKEAKVLDNKCFYPRMFPGVMQADMVLYRMNDFWYNNDSLISFNKAIDIVSKESALFIKCATLSVGGHGVKYVDNQNGNLTELFKEIVTKQIKTDIVIQRPIKQHLETAKFNESSVNTIRFLSLLTEDEVKIYSVVFRMGADGSKVDNACSGGVNCGVTIDGKLKKFAHTWSGKTFEKHPTSNLIFDGAQLPSFDKAIALVKKVHKMTPHFRLVSWDIAICEDGEPLLIEANLSRGGLLLHQLNNGPVFGKDTKKILDEVFKK